MRRALVGLTLITLALAGPALAQGGGGYGDAGGQGMRTGHRGGGMRGGGMLRLDPVVLVGPPAPAEFARIVNLPTDQVSRYGQLYNRFITETRPQRDSLDTLRSQMHDAFADRDRDAMQRQRSLAEPLTKELEQRQAAFDDALRGVLDKDQWQNYEKWRDAQRKQADKDRRKRWQGRRDAAPPA